MVAALQLWDVQRALVQQTVAVKVKFHKVEEVVDEVSHVGVVASLAVEEDLAVEALVMTAAKLQAMCRVRILFVYSRDALNKCVND